MDVLDVRKYGVLKRIVNIYRAKRICNDFFNSVRYFGAILVQMLCMINDTIYINIALSYHTQVYYIFKNAG